MQPPNHFLKTQQPQSSGFLFGKGCFNLLQQNAGSNVSLLHNSGHASAAAHFGVLVNDERFESPVM